MCVCVHARERVCVSTRTHRSHVQGGICAVVARALDRMAQMGKLLVHGSDEKNVDPLLLLLALFQLVLVL